LCALLDFLQPDAANSNKVAASAVAIVVNSFTRGVAIFIFPMVFSNILPQRFDCDPFFTSQISGSEAAVYIPRFPREGTRKITLSAAIIQESVTSTQITKVPAPLRSERTISIPALFSNSPSPDSHSTRRPDENKYFGFLREWKMAHRIRLIT